MKREESGEVSSKDANRVIWPGLFYHLIPIVPLSIKARPRDVKPQLVSAVPIWSPSFGAKPIKQAS